MGLSICYTGSLKDIRQLPTLVAEVSDICEDLHWSCEIIDPDAQLPVQGLGFSPPGAEPVWLTIDEAGSLVYPYSFIWNEPSTSHPHNMLESVMQHAGAESHMRLINLLHYIADKYFTAFTLIDDSEYWETGSAEKCNDWYEMFGVWVNEEVEEREALNAG